MGLDLDDGRILLLNVSSRTTKKNEEIPTTRNIVEGAAGLNQHRVDVRRAVRTELICMERPSEILDIASYEHQNASLLIL